MINLDILKATLLAIYLLVSMVGGGSFVNRKLKISGNIAIAFAVGYSIYALISYALYFFIPPPGLYLILAIFLPGIILGAKTWRELFFNAFPQKIKSLFTNKLILIVFILAAAAYFIVFLNSFTPAKLGDAIDGYMETSRWIFHNGLVSFDPHDTKYSLMPCLTETIFSFSFTFGNEYMAKIFDGFVSLVFLWLVYSFARRRMSKGASLILAISFSLIYDFQWLVGGGENRHRYTMHLYSKFVPVVL